jgi:hypothetical protein
LQIYQRGEAGASTPGPPGVSLAYGRGVPTVQVGTGSRAIRRLGLVLLAINLVFTAGTALFIEEWNHLDWHGRAGRWLINRVLVQFHLATENVVAAWYSSMLLLTVGLAAALAFALEKGTAPFFPSRGQSADGHLFSYGWLALAAAFAGLSLDELGSLHERLGMIRHAGAGAQGWVYVLGVPIVAMAGFMAAFAWVRLRRVPAALGLFAAGIALFVSDPIFELAEMTLLRAGRGNDLAIHNALLVVEEGIVELGGALCFLLGVLTYIRRTAGEGPHVFEITTRAVPWIATAGLLMTAAVPAAHWFVAQLPPGDTGIPDDWFPAAALYGLALLSLLRRDRRIAPAAAALTLSACFGAAVFGYWGWFQRIGYPGEALDAAVTAVAAIVAIVSL